MGHRRGVRTAGIPAATNGRRPSSGLTTAASSVPPCSGGPGLLTLPTRATRPGPPKQGLGAEKVSRQSRHIWKERSQEVERPNRPVRATATLRLSLRARSGADSARSGRTPTCTGHLRCPSSSANGSAAVRCLALLRTRPTTIPVASGRPSHGSVGKGE